MVKNDVRLTLGQNFACGATAGILSKSLTAPLDVVKIRTQVGCWEARLRYINCFEHIHRVGGWKAFWRGNLLGCSRIIPFSVIHLAVFTRLKFKLSDDFGKLSSHTAAVAGAAGGVVATGMLYATDTLKTRFITQPLHNGSIYYKSIWHALQNISQKEGIFSLCRGMSSSALGVIPFTATSFITYKTTVHIFNKLNINLQETWAAFVTGCITATVAHATSFPFDTIRKKMQAWSEVLPQNGGVDVACPNLRAAFKNTVSHYGILGLWRGFGISMFKLVPYTGILYLVYEGCRNACLYYNGYTACPLKSTPLPGVDQSLALEELDELREEIRLTNQSS